MGDLSPIDVVDVTNGDAATARGGKSFEDPAIAASCVAAVATGLAEGSDVVLEDRRQRLNNPNMKFPANERRRLALNTLLAKENC